MDAVYVDSNVVIRFLTKTPAHQYARALALMQRVSRGEVELLLSAAVVGEVAAVLHHSYELPQRDVAEQLIAFVSARGVNTEEPSIVLEALQKSGELKDVDFIDSYVAAKAALRGLPVASFDRDLPRKLGSLAFKF
ncbi:MAG: type II toxin-antitoxin system VapC family toxin [Chloroflexi bacterium]|nr:MAG: type II toxin-antitoxin system VapC family toxin [Chloroflexota bacterium]